MTPSRAVASAGLGIRADATPAVFGWLAATDMCSSQRTAGGLGGEPHLPRRLGVTVSLCIPL